MLLFFLEIIYPRLPGAVPPQDFLISAPQEEILALYAKYLVNLCVWAGGVLALAGLIYGGILYLLSTGKPERMSLAKSQITGAFFGLLILFSSYLLLNTLNPQLTELKLPKIEPVQISVKPKVPLPEITAINSSIDVEMPFSRIIEKLFETYISDYPEPKDKKTPRITKIKDNIETTNKITGKLLSQSKKIKQAADDCECKQTNPCCEILNPGPGCKDNTCRSKAGTTSDPCKNVRDKIKENQTKNKQEITDLVIKQQETEEQIRLLKEQLDRLKRAEKFINECPLRSLISLAQFYNKQDDYNNQEWTLRDIKFWDNVNIRYYLPNIYGRASIMTDNDFATFYCAVSGTMEQEETFLPPPDEDKLAGKTIEQTEEVVAESMACSKEAPVGEIIDRTKRVAQHLIDKLELLVSKDKELIDAVDKLQVLVSKCSSQRCFSFCVQVKGKCVIKRSEDSPQYPEGPCPKSEIADQLNEIQRIKDEIEDIINNKEQGITFIVDKVIPEILQDLEEKVRRPMKKCSEYFFNCRQAKMAIIPPNNQVLRICCKTENSVYGDCFQECYLEIGQDKHRECVQKCLDGLAVMLDDPEISQCIHELNFYCCD